MCGFNILLFLFDWRGKMTMSNLDTTSLQILRKQNFIISDQFLLFLRITVCNKQNY